jgi:hypothetical protein
MSDVITRDCDNCDAEEAPTIRHRGVVLGRLCSTCAKSLSDSLNSATRESTPDTSEFEKTGDQRPEGGTSRGAGTTAEDNDNYDSKQQNSSDSTEHACSWREVYLKMGVFEVGHR